MLGQIIYRLNEKSEKWKSVFFYYYADKDLNWLNYIETQYYIDMEKWKKDKYKTQPNESWK